MNEPMGLFFDTLSTKNKNRERRRSYLAQFTNILASMFKYENLPVSLPGEFIELVLNMEGLVAVWECEGELICSSVSLGGKPDPYGRGTEAICATDNGTVKHFFKKEGTPFYEASDGSLCVVGFNNPTYTADDKIFQWASVLSEIDTSIDLNILYSRYLPWFLARDAKTKAAIEAAMANTKAGEYLVIQSNNLLADIEGNTKEIERIDATDVANSDKIQYLLSAHNEIERWFTQLYGINSNNNTSKQAQMSVDEVNANGASAAVIPMIKKHFREQLVADINAAFGTDISVDFSEVWNIQEAKLEAEVEALEEAPEEAEEKAPEEAEEKTEEEQEVKEDGKDSDED